MKWFLFVSIIGLFVAIGCAGGDSPPMTAEEYVAATCGYENLPDGATWSEVQARTKDKLKRLENVPRQQRCVSITKQKWPV